MSEKTKILLVDDEPDILEFMEYNLVKEGYQVFTAKNGIEAIKVAKEEKPALIILDIMMPVMNGIDACAELKTIPELKGSIIAFLSAKGEDETQIEGLNIGADDFIVKPIKPKVFLARVKALLRRNAADESQLLDFGDFSIDRESYLVKKNGHELTLPKKEFELLLLLTSRPGKVFTRENILRKVWGDEVIVIDRTIDVHIRRLREKIGDAYFKTIKGVGYKFDI